ncbi:L,D-transpeptidase family protein [Roseovarius salis]|uniref:L,D-transpeptidase family protein n=1 Tax=Roseovarius salis TaxID=3376063 RepID=UPI0037CC8670
MLLLLAGLAAGCSKFKTYDGPEVTRVIVQKGERNLFLMHHDRVLRSYPVELGFAPQGHKRFEGDGRTPEGYYYIDRRNPDSAFHLSLGISYPNPSDMAYASTRGKSPGGDIFIHGRPNARPFDRREDWTDGCISLKNRHMQWVYAMVKNGTPVILTP